MKKISELMDELGFDPEGSPAVKEAFIKYLVRHAEGVSVLTPTEKELIRQSPEKVQALPELPTQLSFDFVSESLQKPKSSRKAGSR